ncbi:hypothetical protein CALCODRAFT_425272 [Calocera cornea HHB12733]|uniref:RING-type domain-containing protein n=1 Tax=Calocera cornea HHB12733 TaxID=1353952 RepID=A0A165KAC3_9BASI|nr:hypothetical protein CALCODRAFT_425272 [Calocera cornea HHB12733]
METDFKCNSFKCRKALPCDTEAKAVVTTLPCANELFRSSQICPACETSLAETDDIVICSLRPSNDFKTTVLAGLNPVTILGIAISFWNYQVSQESLFDHAMFKSANEKVAQLQKHLDNVIREGTTILNIYALVLIDCVQPMVRLT